MKVKYKDLELALEYIKLNSVSESIEINTNTADGSAACSIHFIDKQQKAAVIYLYDGTHNVTPELRTTSKLYRK